jgi:quinol monooxygenase YgiN
MLMRMKSTLSLLLVGSLAAACVDDDPDGPGDPMAADDADTAASEDTGEAPAESSGEAPAGSSSSGAGESTGDETTGGAIDVDALYDCEDLDFQVIQPLTGPGIDPMTGTLLEPMQATYVLHTTQILVKPERLDEFFQLSGAVIQQLLQSEGLVGFALAQEPNCGFSRTMGVWESEQAMFAFVGSEAHAQAMTHTTEVSITGRTTAWTATADEMPLTWEMALAAIADVEPSPVYD